MTVEEALTYLGLILGAAGAGAAATLTARRGQPPEPAPAPEQPSGAYPVPASPATQSGQWGALPDPAQMLAPLDDLIERATTRAIAPVAGELREARDDIRDLRQELKQAHADHEQRLRAVELAQARGRKDTPR